MAIGHSVDDKRMALNKMRDDLKHKRINGNALELIMRDVLEGMQEFTRESCATSSTDGLEIISLKKPRKPGREQASIIPFPRKPGRD